MSVNIISWSGFLEESVPIKFLSFLLRGLRWLWGTLGIHIFVPFSPMLLFSQLDRHKNSSSDCISSIDAINLFKVDFMTHRLVCFRFPSCILPKQNENLSFITVHYEQESRKYQRELKQYLDLKKKRRRRWKRDNLYRTLSYSMSIAVGRR